MVFLIQNQRTRGQNRFCPGGGDRLTPVGKGGGRKGVGERIWCKQCVHMYANAKMILVETVSGIRGEGKEVKGGNSSVIYLIHFTNRCKCHNAPPPSTTIKIKKKKTETAWIVWILS
jgi:hypothetical protein